MSDATARLACLRHGIGTREGAADPATWRCVAQVLQTWLVRGDLGPRVADGETGHEVTGRVSQALAGSPPRTRHLTTSGTMPGQSRNG